MVKKEYSKEEISAALTEPRAARKCSRTLGKITETVAVYPLKELRHLRAVEKLATWWRTCGFDRLAEGDDS